MSHFRSASCAKMFDSDLVQPIESKNLIRIRGDGYAGNLGPAVWTFLERQPKAVPVFPAQPGLLEMQDRAALGDVVFSLPPRAGSNSLTLAELAPRQSVPVTKAAW